MKQIEYWIYILQCNNGSYYTGYTTDLSRRFQEHLAGTAKCKYTRSFKPLCIAQSWQFTGSKSTALSLEKLIKKLSKHQKQLLISNPSLIEELLQLQASQGSILE